MADNAVAEAEVSLADPADADSADADSMLRPSERRSAGEWLRARTVPQVLVVAAILLYVAYFTQRSLDNHHALASASYDSGLYDQGMWLLSQGKAPFVTLMGRNLFGDHTSFVLLFLVPLYWIAPGAWIMFFSQSAAIGLGALPIFLYGRTRLRSEWMAIVPAVAYLVHPAVGHTNLENFHPDSFLGVFVGFAIYGALERKWRLYAVFVVLSLLVKEDVSLVLIPLGIWVALRRDRRIGLLTVFGSLWFMLTAMFVVMRGLIGVPTRNGWRIPFGGPSGVLDTAITNPTDLVSHLRSDERPWFIWQMTAPFAWLFVRLPSVALISALVLSTNILSTFVYQYQIEFHYGLIAVPALAMGTVYAIGAMRDRVELIGPSTDDGMGKSAVIPPRVLAILTLALVSFVTSFMWSAVPWSRDQLFHGNPNGEYAVSMREIAELIPSDASVAAHYRVTPHIAYRTEIYQFPTPFRAELYGANDSLAGRRLSERAEGVDFVMLPVLANLGQKTDWAQIESAFDEVASNTTWVLYERDRSVPLPPPSP